MHPKTTALRFLSAAVAFVSAACIAAPPAALSGSVTKTLASSSAAFIENKGQWDSRALFLSRTNGLKLWITQEGPVFDFRSGPTRSNPGVARTSVRDAMGQHIAPGSPGNGHVVKMTFVNARPSAVEGENQQQAKFNYFIGNDRSKWASNVPSYSQAVAQNLYDGISIRYSIDQGAPRYDVIVKPGADPSQVGIKIEGADNARVLPNGNLELKTSLGTVEERGLTAFQETAQGKTQVPCRMTMDGNTVHFDTGAYDTAKPLIIDPLVFSTYLGGNGSTNPDTVFAIAEDSFNDTVVAGSTGSTNFPTTTGAYQTTNTDAVESGFVSKLSPDGSALLFSTYIGATDEDQCSAVALDSSNNVVVTGVSVSTTGGFPTTNGAYQTTTASTSTGFVTKFNSEGSSLLFSTYLGSDNFGTAVALDSSANVFVTGATSSSSFPVTGGAFQTSLNGSQNAFVSELSADGTSLLSSTYLGGNLSGTANAIVLDAFGNPYVAGSTSSTNFPTTSGAYSGTNQSTIATCFISLLSSDGTALIYSTYLGGNNVDSCAAMALDSSGNVVVAGSTSSSNFPTTGGAFETTYNSTVGTGFASVLSPELSTLMASTLIGGTLIDQCNGVGLDSSNNIYLVGQTLSSDFPTTAAGYLTTFPGAATGFVARLNANCTSLEYGSYFGGSEASDSYGLALDSLGNIAFGGETGGSGFPISEGAYQATSTSKNGVGFVAKLGLPPYVTSVNVAPSALTGGQSTTGTVQISAPAGTGGDTISLSTGGSPAASVSPTVTIPKGSTTANFSIATSPVSADASVTVTGSYLGSSETAALTVNRPTVSLLVLSSNSVVGGQSVTGTVYLSAPAGPSGAVVTLGGFYQAFTTPSVTINAGATSAQFTFSTGPVDFTDSGAITASYNDTQKSASLTINPPTVYSVSASPSSVVGGANSLGTVTLTGPAAGEPPRRAPGDGGGGVFVQLSSNTSEVTVPTEVEVLNGNTMASFNIQTVPVSTTSVATITATYNDTTQTTTLTLTPSTISKFSFYPAVIIGGQTTSGTVTIAGPAGSTGNKIKLSSSTAEATVPATITVAAGQTSAQFTVNSVAVSSDSVATIKATFGTVYQTATVTLLPSPVKTISFASSSIVGGQNASCTITLTGKAGPYGNVIKLVSSTSELTVPATVTIPAGTSSYTFSVPTVAVSSSSQTTVTSTFALDSHSTTLTLRPATLTNLILPTSPVVGGQTATGAVQLSSVAGQYGNVVKIKSNNGDVTVPATVTVPGGQASANFTIHTVAVTSNRTITISITFGTTTLTKTLTLAP